eukprot:scaffold68421_cov18-Tisochrysis_lutea.AAC.1
MGNSMNELAEAPQKPGGKGVYTRRVKANTWAHINNRLQASCLQKPGRKASRHQALPCRCILKCICSSGKYRLEFAHVRPFYLQHERIQTLPFL